MLNLTKFALSSALIFSVSACSASVETTEMNVKISTPHATVKPGASVSMTSELPKSMVSGTFQPVQLSFQHAYANGVMTVSVDPSAGLDLFGSASSRTFDLASPGPHVWDLDAKSDVDGVYFLNVFTEAHNESRSFSVQLDIGQTIQKTSGQKTSDEIESVQGQLVDGGTVRVMDAEETIE